MKVGGRCKWALVTLILQMIKFFSISLKLFALGFDGAVPVLGECGQCATKVTLADFQQFIFPPAETSLPYVLLILLSQPPAPPPSCYSSAFLLRSERPAAWPHLAAGLGAWWWVMCLRGDTGGDGESHTPSSSS